MVATTGISQRLQDNLRSAMAAELTTIPTYLYAYWSIKPISEGGSQGGAEAAQIILSVIVEEMLHMGLVSNILNALGGTPAIAEFPYLPQYPCHLLRTIAEPGIRSVEVKLQRFSQAALHNFLQIERPDYQPHPYVTLGEFYDTYIYPELTPNLDYKNGKQLPNWDNPGVGRLISVSSSKEALEAVNLIVEQGEGLSVEKHDDGEHELAHFWKFKAIERSLDKGFIDLEQDVYPIIDMPDASRYTADQQTANTAFNSAYSDLLDTLQTTFVSESPDVFFASTGLMDRLKQLAVNLRATGPVPGTECLPGPTFEYIDSCDR